MGISTRNAFIVSKALKTFVLAAVLTAAACQLAHTADSMIVGHTVGPDAVAAINLVLPLVEFLNCMGFLICFGANAMCAQAIGSDNKEAAAKTFTSVILSVMTLGLGASLLISVFSPQIVDFISDEPSLNDMAVTYIRTYSMGAWLLMLSFELNLCCEELMTNIDQYSVSHASERSFDLHVYINDGGAYVTIKDDGRPFDPIKAGKMGDKRIGDGNYMHLGLRLVNQIIPDITYKYMYGQNTVFIFRPLRESNK
jgi:anti-sigma regulatory factor (Ser/Thr protein kinase)